MSNICIYTYDPNILTQAKVNREFTLIHKHLCYLESQTGGGGTGTVTSVGLSLPAIFTVSGSPVTTNGTLSATLATQTANTVFAGPGTGAAAGPTFRALVAADIPVPTAASGLSVGLPGLPKYITLGQLVGDGTDSGRLSRATEIPLNGFAYTVGHQGSGSEFTVDANNNILVSGSTSGSLTTPTLEIDPFWNTTGIVTGFLINAFDTASNVASKLVDLQVGGQSVLNVHKSGRTAVKFNGLASANLHIGAGTATAGTAPLKFIAGVNLTATEAGAIEYDGSHLYFTAANAGTRFQLDQQVTSGAFILNQTSQQPTSNFNISGNGIVGGSLNATGVLSSSSTSQIAGVTNSGVTINGGNNFAYVSLFDQNQTVNNRTGELIFISGQLQLRFLNDAHSSAVIPLSITGGQATGITGITSNSGSGQWVHTGNHVATGTVSSLPAGGNSVILTGSAFAGTPTISTDGANANVSLQINTKGGGGITLNSASNVVGTFTVSTLAGSGTNMVVASSTGVLSTQALPSSLLSYQHTIFTPTTGGTVNLVNGQYNIINPAGALVALTLNLPSSPINNDTVYIKFTQSVTTVTYANGTVVDGITAPTAGGLTVLVFDSGTASWY